MNNTRDKLTKGIVSDGKNIYKSELLMIFTSDTTHETLSITNNEVQFIIDYAEVEKLVAETRKERNAKLD